MAKYYIACMALIFAAALMVESEAMSCGQVAGYVSPCINYLRNGGPLPESCCSGVRNLNKAASTTAERRNVCGCLVNTAGKVKGLKQNLVSDLPSDCGVSLPFKIIASTNCDVIN